MEQKIVRWRVFPADSNGNCLRGFCPTVCNDCDLTSVVTDLGVTLYRFRVKYTTIKAIEL